MQHHFCAQTTFHEEILLDSLPFIALNHHQMAAFKKDDYESDMSDEIQEDGEELSAWLDEEEPEEDPATKVKPVVVEQAKVDVVRKSKYVVENVDLFYALCEVDDWGFVEFPDEQQEAIMKALTIVSYQPGENIIVEGDGGNDCYIVSASEETAHFAEVEVVTGNILEGTEVFLTRLQRGQYFGQKYFLTRRAVRLKLHHYSAISVYINCVTL